MWNNRNNLLLIALTVSCFVTELFGQSNRQNQREDQIEPGIPYKNIPRTQFSCVGRGSGYYADVETGCQIYHMCDASGRQFDYACPNATLFQQRMLICDHWYMVNCSKSESNYKANLLIGQLGVPFVSEHEHELRTPRPDLLDQPYAANYAGESYRRQVNKNNYPALQNAIAGIDFSKNYNKKSKDEILESSASNHIIPAALQTIRDSTKPDVFESTTPIPQSDDTDLSQKNNGRRDVIKVDQRLKNDDSSESGRRVYMKPPPVVFEPPKLLPDSNPAFRQLEEQRLRSLNTKQAFKPQVVQQKAPVFAQAKQPVPVQQKQQVFQQQKVTTTARTTVRTTTLPPRPVVLQPKTAASNINLNNKAPVKNTFNPDKNFKAFEHILNPGKTATFKDYDFSRYFQNRNTAAPNSAQRRQDAFQKPLQTTTRQPIVTTTTPRPTTTQRPTTRKPITFAPITTTTVRTTIKPFVIQRAVVPDKQVLPPLRNVQVTVQTTQRPQTNPPKVFSKQVTIPARTTFDSLPREPLIANTNKPVNIQRPAIDLQPPHKTFPGASWYDEASTIGPPIYTEWKIPASGLLPPKFDNETNTNEISSRSSDGKQTRSIQGEGNFGENNDALRSSSTNKNPVKFGARNAILPDPYKDLQKKFSIPDFLFPIEATGRDGYENLEALNSFQVRIPLKNNQQDRFWYTENNSCPPECHPAYLRPGTCEPCVRQTRR